MKIIFGLVLITLIFATIVQPKQVDGQFMNRFGRMVQNTNPYRTAFNQMLRAKPAHAPGYRPVPHSMHPNSGTSGYIPRGAWKNMDFK